MTLSSSYKSGTITVSAGGTQVIGTGTNWTGFGVREGDIIWAGGIDVAVASVEGPTALTLAFPWAGPALSGSPYEIRPTPDASRVLTASREAIESLETIQGDLYASANVYSTIVEGLAATATGSQFQVAQGTEIVRFVKTAPGFATELARYMTAPGVTAAVAQATAKDAALTLAIRDGAVLPLTNIGGTGDAISADLQATMIAAGITTLSAIAEVEYIPVAGNTLTDPTLTVAGVTYTIKDFDGGVWPAGGFVANRIYKLRRRGMTLRVTSGNLSRTDVAAQISIEATARAAGDTASRDRANHSGVQPITTVTGLSAALDGLSQARADGDAAEATARAAEDSKLSLALRDGAIIPLTNIAGTGDAITADLQATMINAGVTSLSAIAEVEYVPTATNTSVNPTITIAGVTYGIRDADGGTWPAGGFSTARIYKLRRRSATMRVVSGALIPADMAAETAARAAEIAAKIAISGVVPLTNVAGTANVITADLTLGSGVTVADGTAVKLTPTADNTGSVRLTVGGGTQRSVVDRAGNQIAPGGMRAGRTYTLRRVVGVWRIEGGDVTDADIRSSVDAAVSTLKPVQTAVTSASTPLERNSNLWNVAPVFRTVTAAVINGAPADVANPATATAETLISAGGVRLIWRDQSGQARERFWNGSTWTPWESAASGAAIAAEKTARESGDASNAAAIVAETERSTGAETALGNRVVTLEGSTSTSLWRGDTAVAASMNGLPVWTVDAQGRHRLILDDWTVADLESRLDIASGGGGGGSAAPVSPDLLGSIDGWSVWQDADGLLTFTADLWGDYPREYVMLPIAGSVPWINGRSDVPLHLVYGDETAQGPVSVSELTHTHQVSTLADGAAQLGYEGAVPDAPATGITRTGPRFASVAADRWLATQPVAKWALARSEAVTGATLANLATGQPLANLERAVDQAALVLAPYGRIPFVEAVSILHGAGDDTTTYAADMVTLMGAVNLATGARKICLYQPSGTTDRSNFRSADGLVEAFRDKGTLPAVLVAPTYWCGIRAGTIAGFTAESLTQLAELGVHAQNTAGWVPPLMFRAQRSGAIINLDFEVTPGRSLVAPSSGLTAQGGTISGMAVVPDPDTALMTRLQVTLSGVPGGAVTIRYARSATGRVSGDMRDNWSAPSVTGGTLRNYATSFEAVV